MSEDKKRKNNINETIPTVVQRNTEDELQEWVQNLDELLTSTVIRSRRTTQVSILTIMLDKLDTLRMNSFAVTHAICMNNVQANNCNIENLKKSFDEKLKETKILFLQILLSFIAIMFAIGFGILYLIEVQGFSNVIQSLKYLFAWVCAIIALLTFFLKKILKLFK